MCGILGFKTGYSRSFFNTEASTPLDYDSLQKKFETLVNIGANTRGSRTYSEEFKQWCEDNRYGSH